LSQSPAAPGSPSTLGSAERPVALGVWRQAEAAAHHAAQLDAAEGTPASERAAAHLQAGDAFMAALCVERALAEYEHAVSLDASQADAFDRAERERRALGDLEGVALLKELRLGGARPAERRILLADLVQTWRSAHRPDQAVEIARQLMAEIKESGGAPSDVESLLAAESLLEGAGLASAAGEDTAALAEEAAARLLDAARGRLHVDSASAPRLDDQALSLLRRTIGAAPASAAADAARHDLGAQLAQGGRFIELARLREDQAAHLTSAGRDDEARAVQVAAAAARQKAGDLEGARRLLEAAVRHEPPEGERAAHAALMQVLADQGDVAALCALAEQDLSSADQREVTTRLGRYLELAEQYERTADSVRSAELLRAALESEPLSQAAHDRLAELLKKRHLHHALCDLEEAAAAAEEEGGRPPAVRATRLAELAQLYEERLGDVERAQATWRRLQALPAPSVPPEVRERAQASERRLSSKARMAENLTAVLEKEITGAPEGKARAEAERRLAQVLKDRGGDLPRAIALYESALRFAPADQAILRALVDLYERIGDAAGVARALEGRLKAGVPAAEKRELLRRLAWLYEESLDDPASALRVLGEIAAALPNDRETLLRTERLARRLGDQGRLAAVLEARADAASSPAERLRLVRESARTAAPDDPDALSRWKKILKIVPSDAEALTALLRLDGAASPREVADAFLRAAKEDPIPTRRPAHLKTAAELMAGDDAMAVRTLRQAVELSPFDRSAWKALAVVAGRRQDRVELVRVAARLAELEDEPRARADAFVRLAEQAAADPRAALEAMVRAVQAAPHDASLWRQRRDLELRVSNPRDAVLTLERALCATQAQGPARLEWLGEIADLWATGVRDNSGSISAMERAVDAAPDDQEWRRVLVDLYTRYNDVDRLCAQADWLWARTPAGTDRRRLATETAAALRRVGADSRLALSWLRRAHDGDPDDVTLMALRDLATTAGLHEDLADVLQVERRKTRAPEVRKALARELAALFAGPLATPRRAAETLLEQLREDPGDSKLLADLEATSETAEAWDLVDTGLGLAADVVREPAARAALMVRRASILDRRIGDPLRALEELTTALALTPADEALGREVARLAEETSRPDLALRALAARHASAPTRAEKRRLAEEAARLAESRLANPWAALRAMLRALMAAPEDLAIDGELWRLASAAQAAGGPVNAPIPTPPAPPAKVTAAPVPEPQALALDGPDLDSDTLTEQRPRPRPRSDITLELSSEDLMATEPMPLIESSYLRGDATMELGSEDLEALSEPSAPAPRRHSPTLHGLGSLPPPTPASTQAARPALPAAEQLIGPLPEARSTALTASPWTELAAAYAILPAAAPKARAERARRVARMWSEGAHDAAKGFGALRDAELALPGDPDTRTLAEQIAEQQGAWPLLHQHLAESIDRASSPQAAAELVLRLAGYLEAAGKDREAEARYRDALGIAVDVEAPAARLEALYRRQGRMNDLASLLEERLAGSHIDADRRRATRRELAALYEEPLDKPYEAITAWESTLDAGTAAERADAHEALARLYARVGRMRKAADSLLTQADLLLDAAETTTAEMAARARQARRRAAELFDRELGMPEKAIEIYRLVADGGEDPSVLLALDRLLESRGRYKELAEVLARRIQHAKGDERSEALRRRAVVLRDRLSAPDQAAACFRELALLTPNDDTVTEQLANALLAAGRAREAESVLVSRVAAAEARKARPEAVAELILEVALLRARRLGDTTGARDALRRALALSPSNTAARAELERLSNPQPNDTEPVEKLDPEEPPTT
jgi:hypothetical protein